MNITGIGSVTPYGVLAGAVSPRPLQPGDRPAYLVEPFRPLDVVPGLKTRRLDRLSVWSLVAASIAIKDAGLDLDQVDRSRVAVVMATGLGCIELTETFFLSAAARGWSQTDPIVFPETLGNAPASHVARHLDLRGPNITVGSKGLAAECALLQAVSLLRNRQVDFALVLAGDTLTRSSREWYEAAGTSSIPSEGVTAIVLEPASSQRCYATFRAGHFASGTNPAAVIERVLKASGAGLRPAIRCVSSIDIRETLGEHATILQPDPIAAGLGDTGALLQLGISLAGEAPSSAALLLVNAAAHASYSALVLELPKLDVPQLEPPQ
jgi:3-oxoacyl-[acyl-carrier-protein] synthase II